MPSVHSPGLSKCSITWVAIPTVWPSPTTVCSISKTIKSVFSGRTTVTATSQKHVLPDGFQRIRYYGFLGNRDRRDKLEQCRRLLGMPAPADPTNASEKDCRDRYEELTGHSLHQCPQCRLGRMLVVMILPRPLCKSAPLPTDSS